MDSRCAKSTAEFSEKERVHRRLPWSGDRHLLVQRSATCGPRTSNGPRGNSNGKWSTETFRVLNQEADSRSRIMATTDENVCILALYRVGHAILHDFKPV